MGSEGRFPHSEKHTLSTQLHVLLYGAYIVSALSLGLLRCKVHVYVLSPRSVLNSSLASSVPWEGLRQGQEVLVPSSAGAKAGDVEKLWPTRKYSRNQISSSAVCVPWAGCETGSFIIFQPFTLRIFLRFRVSNSWHVCRSGPSQTDCGWGLHPCTWIKSSLLGVLQS